MAGITSELLAESQVKRRNKRVNIAVHIETRHWQQHADGLGCELPIEEARLDDLFLLLLAPVPAVDGMLDFAVLLHFSARSAQLEGSIHDRAPGNGQLRTSGHLLAKVHFAHSNLPKELEAERHLFAVDEVRFADIGVFLHHEHVFLVELRLAVVAFVVGAALLF